jgi:mono/diheme cytochrome c family protein
MKSARISIVILSAIFGIGTSDTVFSFQAPGSRGKGSPDPPKGNLQRSAEIMYFKRFAESGPERGKEIYFYKCWVCHNEYTRAAGTASPTLKDLYKRPKLISGQPVNDQTITAKIKNGGPNMPGYQYTLNDQDLADLVSFLREGKCCWEDSEEKEPPRNPRYKAK